MAAAEREHVVEFHYTQSKRLRLSPDLLEALRELADREGSSLEGLLVDLINEGLAHRLRRR